MMQAWPRYKVLRSAQYEHAGRALRPLRLPDMEPIRLYRNAQIDVLRQKTTLRPQDQERYYHAHVAPTFDSEQPPHVLLGYWKDDELIGYGGLVHIDWESRRAEVSFLVAPSRVSEPSTYEADFLAFLGLLTQVAFGDLGFLRLWTETFDVRPHHVKILERFGFCLEGRLRQHVQVQGCQVDSLVHGLLRGDVERSE